MSCTIDNIRRLKIHGDRQYDEAAAFAFSFFVLFLSSSRAQVERVGRF
jgi:hypothetical protein